jgi:hypothetical protein
VLKNITKAIIKGASLSESEVFWEETMNYGATVLHRPQPVRKIFTESQPKQT